VTIRFRLEQFRKKKAIIRNTIYKTPRSGVEQKLKEFLKTKFKKKR